VTLFKSTLGDVARDCPCNIGRYSENIKVSKIIPVTGFGGLYNPEIFK
jgi:hypothetical protein